MAEGNNTPGGKKRATIWEVARSAGVSHQTVSRYLRNDGGMKPATRARIDKAVAELDYRPNLIARSMRTQRSNRIAVVLPELTHFAPIPILRGASAAAREAGYTTDVVGLEGGQARRAEGARALLDSGLVDGILSFAPLADVGRAAGGSVPLVVFGEYDDEMHSQGEMADAGPVEDILRHLAGLGHRRFLHVAGPRDWASADNRRARYAESVEKLGLESYGTRDGDWTVASGYRAARDLPDGSGVTAVLAANDHMALGVIRGLQDRGVRVPEDVSVFGWDNEQFGEYVRPALSTVASDGEALGRQAVRSLLAAIRGEPAPEIRVPNFYEVVPRGSSGPAPR
jgi:LacI family transcriptional regulator